MDLDRASLAPASPVGGTLRNCSDGQLRRMQTTQFFRSAQTGQRGISETYAHDSKPVRVGRGKRQACLPGSEVCRPVLMAGAPTNEKRDKHENHPDLGARFAGAADFA